MDDSKNSIRRRLMSGLAISLIALYGIGAVGIYGLVRFSLYKQLDDHLAHNLEDFVSETERKPNGEVESSFHEAGLDSYAASGEAGGSFYQLWDFDGNTIYRSESLASAPSLPFRKVAGEDCYVHEINLRGEIPGRIAYTSFPLELDEIDFSEADRITGLEAMTSEQKAYVENYDSQQRENRVYLAIATDTIDVRNTLLILRVSLLGTGMVLVAAGFFLIRRIVRNACQPIIKMAALTGDIGPSNLELRLPTGQIPVEMRPLILKFNDLIERLDEGMKRERRFSIDIAHELRTPIAEMRTLLEVATVEAEDPSPTIPLQPPLEIYQTGASISQRMSRIVETISALHSGAEVPEEEKRKVNIGHLIASSVESLSPQESNRITINCDPEIQTIIETDSAVMRAVIDNLIINSTCHSLPGTPVDVTILETGFSIENQAPDLSEDDLKSMGEPFWQKDKARADSDRFGLGLALVMKYLDMLGASIVFRKADNKLVTRVHFSGSDIPKIDT